MAVEVGRSAAWLAKQVEIALGAVDLSLPQYRVLGILGEGTAASSALAERLAVRPPSITAVVDGLVHRGLVDRSPCPGDRRRVTLEITAAGKSLLTLADSAVEERLATIAEELPDELASRALESLQLWGRALRAYHESRTARR